MVEVNRYHCVIADGIWEYEETDDLSLEGADLKMTRTAGGRYTPGDEHDSKHQKNVFSHRLGLVVFGTLNMDGIL